jgi:hypothetical protein
VSLLARTHAVLDARGIPHALIGAAALAVHGVSRSTLDVDLLATAPGCLEPATWDELSAAGVDLGIRRGDADDPLAGVVRIQLGDEAPVDIVVGRSRWQDDVLRRAVPRWVGDVELPVATPADVVLLKLFAGGAQDRWDVVQLLAGPERERLVQQVDAEIGKLPPRCRRTWRRLLRG